MNPENNNHEVRLEPRTAQTAAGAFSAEPVFGDARWVAEHIEWIRRHYGRYRATEAVTG
jgi:hypothetical protein